MGDPHLITLLQNGQVLAHPWVIGELALGHLGHRRDILELLHNLPHAAAAIDAEVLTMIENLQLAGLWIGYVDAHLLASTLLTAGASLRTRDKRLAAVAAELGLARKEAAEP